VQNGPGKLTIQDLNLVEPNEAFAVQVASVRKFSSRAPSKLAQPCKALRMRSALNLDNSLYDFGLRYASAVAAGQAEPFSSLNSSGFGQRSL
jgi:hypothetical protein